MRRRILSLVLVLAILLAGLSACGNPAADQFYDMVDEMTQLENARISLRMPYHGASMVVEGFVCRSSQTADLTVTLQGTGEATDGLWTELRIDGNDIWLNVEAMATRALAFPLLDLREGEIDDFLYEQTDDWVLYQWQGNFWDGSPSLADLLRNLWHSTRSDLSDSISSEGESCSLELSEADYQTALIHVAEDLVATEADWQSAVLAVTDAQPELTLATTWDPTMLLGTWWSSLSEWLESGAAVEGGLSAAVSRTEDGAYQASMTRAEETWSLTLTPCGEQPVSEPEDYMEFGAYDAWLYYLTTFSWQYIGEAYDGTQDMQAEGMLEVGSEQELMPMTVSGAPGYTGISTIQFVPEDGVAEMLPVLNGYLSNEVSSIAGDGAQITQLTLHGPGWTQIFETETAGENASAVAASQIEAYYSTFIDTSGYLLVQDISEVSRSSDGMSAAQGFSYRRDDFSDPEGRIIIAYRPGGCATYTVIELDLSLASLSDETKSAISELFAYLNLELPISLEA